MRHVISQGLLHPAIEVDIDGVPPCLSCGEPVASPSMDAPLVCGACDCGRNRDGSKWTDEQAAERHAHRRSQVATYRVQMVDRRVREMKDLLATIAASPARYTAIETGESRMEGDASDVAAFTVLARKLLPDLIERDELRGAAVAKGADACGAARGERNRLDTRVEQLEEALGEAIDIAEWEASEYQGKSEHLGRLPQLRDVLAYKAQPCPQKITIGNIPSSEALHATMRLRASLRAATEKLRPEMIRELRALLDDPRRPRAGEAHDANQADYERRALPVLLVATLALLAMHEEVARLAKEEPFVEYELAKGGPWP